jgi:hypothetical protein
MKRLATLIALISFLLAGCASRGTHRGGAATPGDQTTGAFMDSKTDVAPNSAGITNEESAASQKPTEDAAKDYRAATNAKNSGGAGAGAGGTLFGRGTGTGGAGPLFWFYVALGIVFLVWLIFAILHRVRRRKLARQEVAVSHHRRRRHHRRRAV